MQPSTQPSTQPPSTQETSRGGKNKTSEVFEIIFGFLALAVVVYRIAVYFSPEIYRAVQDKNVFRIFRAFVLLV